MNRSGHVASAASRLDANEDDDEIEDDDDVTPPVSMDTSGALCHENRSTQEVNSSKEGWQYSSFIFL